MGTPEHEPGAASESLTELCEVPPGSRVGWWKRIRWQPFAFGLALGVIYVLLIQAQRLSMPPGYVFQGWGQYDMPTYYANARAVFEDGNGLFYANPYSLRRDSERIYSHLLILAAGWLWKAGFGFHAQEIFWTIAGSALMFGLLWFVIGRVFPPGRWRLWTYSLVSLGGGITGGMAVVIAASNYFTDAASRDSGFSTMTWAAQFDLERPWGYWALSLVRNVLYSTECVYHALFFGAMLAALSGRRWLAVFLAFVTWWTHPFTGLELGTVLLVWLGVETLLAWRRKLPAWPWLGPLGVLLAVQALFAAYNGPWLSRSPEHASLVGIWRGAAAIRMSTAPMSHDLFAYGPLLAGLLWLTSRAGRQALRESATHRLLVCWCGVVFLLIHHDKIPGIRHPIQPLHFARGYLYTVLGIWLGLWLADLATRYPSRKRMISAVGAGILVLALGDSALFFDRYFRGGSVRRNGVIWIPSSMAGALSYLGTLGPGQRVLTLEEDPQRGLGYLMRTETAQRALLSHTMNTPYLSERTSLYREWLGKPSGTALDDLGITVVIADTGYLGRPDLLPVAPAERVRWLDEQLGKRWQRVADGTGPPGYVVWLRGNGQQSKSGGHDARR